ncbi:MAG: glycoside hydrolase family protein [Planctomycetota bacterium]
MKFQSNFARGSRPALVFLWIVFSGAGLLSQDSTKLDLDLELDLQVSQLPVPDTAKFIDDEYYIWGGSAMRGPNGKYHLLYSRWPRKLKHRAWVTHSEIAYAVSDRSTGPFKHANVALAERGEEFWDGHCTHNPTVHKFGDKYYLYYMGNRGDRKPTKRLNWTHRNNQRIGVAVASHPAGPWKRFDKPLIDVSQDKDAPDALMTSNPSICRRADGKYILIYKAVGLKRPEPFGGPVVHIAATSDRPTGPFEKLLKPLFVVPGENFSAEDPFIWSQGDRCWAIVNDHHGAFNGVGSDSLSLFTSTDGLNWSVATNPLVSNRTIDWANGKQQKLHRLERPQLLLENGLPVALFCAAEETEKQLHSFNVHIPLRTKN